MERLTARTKNGHAYLVNVKPDEQEVNSPHKNTLQCILDCFERLAQYEDLEEQGRLVVLPCWGHVFIHSDGHVQEMEMCHYRGNTMGVYDMRCECINQEEDCDYLCGFENGDVCAYNFRIAELGKTVFLTRAAAEAALKEGKP